MVELTMLPFFMENSEIRIGYAYNREGRAFDILTWFLAYPLVSFFVKISFWLFDYSNIKVVL